MQQWLTARLRTLITLAALVALMLFGLTWGWAQVKKPFPGKVDAGICADTTYHSGEQLFVQDVVVNVFNASSREGLARLTQSELTDAGFAPGVVENAPGGTAISAPAEIWVKDVSDPAAKLLRARLGKVPVVAHADLHDPGIVLVVGDSFGALRKGPDSVVLTQDAVVCSPQVD